MAAVVQPLPRKPLDTLEERRIAVDSSLGSTLAEGVPPSPAGIALAERYASGEISLEEYGISVRDLYGI